MSKLTQEQIAAIRARLAGKMRYGPHPDFPNTTDDIRALLAHVAALDAENARLRLWFGRGDCPLDFFGNCDACGADLRYEEHADTCDWWKSRLIWLAGLAEAE